MAAQRAPADAEGIVVVAQAPRLARWLARHRAVGVLAAAAIPRASSGARSLQPIALSLARTARGPVVAWWGVSCTGLAAPVARSDLAGLRQVAALQAHGWREEGGEGNLVDVAVFQGALGTTPAALAAPLPPRAGAWSALLKVHGRWWYLRFTRGGLTAQSGTPPALPECGGETRVVSGDLSFLLARGASPMSVPGALLVATDGGWGVRFGDPSANTPFERVVRALGGRRELPGDPSVLEWHSPLGTLFYSVEPGVAVATRPEILARLPLATSGSEWGCLRGEVVAGALTSTAAMLNRLPGLPSQQQVTLAASALRQVRECSWRIEPTGGQLELRW